MFIRVVYFFVLQAVVCSLLPVFVWADIIVDNEPGPPVYTESGVWSLSSGTGYRGGAYRYSTQAGAFATWTPYLPHDRQYDVYAVFRTGTNRAEDANYTITHAGGTTVIQVSQYSSSTSVVEVHLGPFDFNAGANSSVRLDAVTDGKVYVADAIIFRSSSDDPPMIFPADRFPVRPLFSDSVQVTAVITDDDAVATASLTYTTTLTTTAQTLPAFDDSTHGDGAAGDGMYGAVIPPQSGGTTVTYSFTAQDTIGQESGSPTQSYTVSATPFPEFRAIWTASWWSGFLNQDEANDWVDTCRANNINALVPEVRKIGDAYYDSALEPRASNITGGASYDPLGYTLQIAHDTSGGKKRLQVHAWFVTHRIWMNSVGDLPSGHILLQHPEYEMIKYDGATDPDSRWLDPGHPGTGEHNVAVILDCLSKYDIDGVHLDYIRYPGKDWGYNPTSVERFNTLYGRSGTPATTDTLWSDWRRECVSLEVKKLYIKMWMIRPNVLLSAATQAYGNYNNFEESGPYASTLQDWVGWLHEGIIDYNMIMNYKDETQWDNFQGWVDRTLAEDDRRGSVPGVSASRVTTVQGTMDQLLYIRSRGADGMNIFSWRGEVSGNTIGETREQFYAALKNQVFPTWVDPPATPWKADPTTGIFEGTVTFQGQPVDHAEVWIEGHPDTRTVTDGSGWYGILDVPVGHQTLHFAKQGLRDVLVPSPIPNAGDIVTVYTELEQETGTASWWLFE